MSKKILVTGSNGGFGKLTVMALLENGHKVAATMRNVESKNKEAAQELAKAGAHVVEMDVTNETSVNNAVNKAINLLGGLDVVVNNAGVGVIGMQEHFSTEEFKRLFDVNVFGVQRVNRAALPHLRKNNSGLIIYVSSLLGRICIPFYGPYNASKWALEAMAENYRTELSGFGIENCIVEPGGFPTSFFDKMIKPSDTSRNEDYGDFNNAPEQMFNAFEGALAGNPEQKPENVAQAVVNLVGAENGQRPFRTIVDKMGMGEPLKSYNEDLEKIHEAILANFEMGHMLETKVTA